MSARNRYEAVWPLHVALVTALAAHPDVAAALDATETGPAIYSAVAPDGAPGRRLVLSTTTGGRFDTFDSAGAAPTVQLDGYAPGPGHDVVAPIAAAVAAALDGVALVLPAPEGGWPGGGTIVTRLATVELISQFLEPDALTMHGVLSYGCTLARE